MRKAWLAALLFLIAGTLGALDLSSGKIRLGLYPDTGRFSVYFEKSSGLYVPLFSATDPRTSVLVLRVGDSYYRMGDSREFTTSVQKTAGGGTITWTSAELTVKEEFSFATSNGSTAADGVRIAIVIVNHSKRSLSVGAKVLIDTYLGEASHIHFTLPSGSDIASETQFLAPKVPAFWLSPQDRQDTIALQCVTTGSGVTSPNRIVFANWKRLYDTDWAFTVVAGRAFNLLPYSINDDAVAMYYDPETLQPGTSRAIHLLLGEYAPAGWAGPGASPAPGAARVELPGATTSPAPRPGSPHTSTSSSEASVPPATTRAAVESDLTSVQDTLDQIDGLLSGRTRPTQADIQALSKVLDKLAGRKNNYAGK